MLSSLERYLDKRRELAMQSMIVLNDTLSTTSLSFPSLAWDEQDSNDQESSIGWTSKLKTMLASIHTLVNE